MSMFKKKVEEPKKKLPTPPKKTGAAKLAPVKPVVKAKPAPAKAAPVKTATPKAAAVFKPVAAPVANKKADDLIAKEAERVSGVGHNGGPSKVNGVDVKQLRSIIERVERLEEEKAAIGEDVKDVYSEAKGNGYDVKTIRKIILLRKQDAAEREEAEYLLSTYQRALGMLPELE